MKRIRNLAVMLILTSIVVLPAFANRMVINLKEPSEAQEITPWYFPTLNDGRYFILGPENPNVLILSVDEIMANGLPSDYVSVDCNTSHYRIAPGASQICYGNFSDLITMYIDRKDFKNGAQGTYELKPKP